MDHVIVFADVSGSTALYDRLGDAAAFALIERCLAAMSACTREAGGRVVKTIGDAVMADFPAADAGAAAAIEMQLAVAAVGAAVGTPLSLRIGLHAGAVLEQDGDVFGDAVNLAARLCDLASRGQIITSLATARGLARMFQPALRRLYALPVKGKEAEVELVEIAWSGGDEDRTTIALASLPAQAAARLTLRLRELEAVLGPDRRKVTFGRSADADFAIADRMASRAHAMIERRRDKFVLVDHSANGTYVSPEGEPEALLRREEYPLHGRGRIAFGQPCGASTEVVSYRCDSG